MQPESIAGMLPKVVIPYLRQWAEGSGLTVLSRLLVDEQFLAVIARYADDLIPPPRSPGAPRATGNAPINGHSSPRNGHKPANAVPQPQHVQAEEANDADLAGLYARVSAMEAQQKQQEALFEVLRSRIRPLASALGCCPECMVGLELCPRCFGQSKVAYFEPDTKLLRALIIDPLIARGVPLTLGEAHDVRSSRQSQSGSMVKNVTKKRSKS